MLDNMTYWIENADSALLLPTLPAASVDALVTDPPAGIGFMGKEWDDFRRARNPADAGRDSVHGRLSRSGPEYGRRDRDHFIAWLAGILTECRRIMKPGAYGWVWAIPRTSHWTAMACEDAGFAVRDVMTHIQSQGFPKSRSLLKPAAEHWILVKAPGELRELRIDENRIATSDKLGGGRDTGPTKVGEGWDRPWMHDEMLREAYAEANRAKVAKAEALGRWPANFALSHSDDCEAECVEDCPVRLLDEQAGPPKSGAWNGVINKSRAYNVAKGVEAERPRQDRAADSGGASRFFYVAKASTKERSAGLPERNSHPTVKSIALMRHLIRLVAAPGSLILDPFTGSGSTAVAALQEGCRFAGIEQDPQHAETARLRTQHAYTHI